MARNKHDDHGVSESSMLHELVKAHVAAMESTNQLISGTNSVLKALSTEVTRLAGATDIIHDFIKREIDRKASFRNWVLHGFLMIILMEALVIAALVRALGNPSGGIIGAVLSGLWSFL
jgi:hypothetical protein